LSLQIHNCTHNHNNRIGPALEAGKRGGPPDPQLPGAPPYIYSIEITMHREKILNVIDIDTIISDFAFRNARRNF
jgi:hypothetical protein